MSSLLLSFNFKIDIVITSIIYLIFCRKNYYHRLKSTRGEIRIPHIYYNQLMHE